jgi:hypothetical protein
MYANITKNIYIYIYINIFFVRTRVFVFFWLFFCIMDNLPKDMINKIKEFESTRKLLRSENFITAESVKLIKVTDDEMRLTGEGFILAVHNKLQTFALNYSKCHDAIYPLATQQLVGLETLRMSVNNAQLAALYEAEIKRILTNNQNYSLYHLFDYLGLKTVARSSLELLHNWKSSDNSGSLSNMTDIITRMKGIDVDTRYELIESLNQKILKLEGDLNTAREMVDRSTKALAELKFSTKITTVLTNDEAIKTLVDLVRKSISSQLLGQKIPVTSGTTNSLYDEQNDNIHEPVIPQKNSDSLLDISEDELNNLVLLNLQDNKF